MKQLQNAIAQAQEKLDRAREERQQASIEQFATLDKEILRQELLLKHLKESQQLQELREKGQAPTDIFLQAKLHATELLDQALSDGIDFNGIRQIPQNDREMIHRAIYHNRQELL